MREILFKAMSINGDWHEGLLSISQGHADHPEKGCYISNKAGSPFAYLVRPETVGQFTGLFDKNRNKIFEGDILTPSCYIRFAGDAFKVVVTFDLGTFGLDLNGVFIRHFRPLYKSINSARLAGNEYEIIGNIHDYKYRGGEQC